MEKPFLACRLHETRPSSADLTQSRLATPQTTTDTQSLLLDHLKTFGFFFFFFYTSSHQESDFGLLWSADLSEYSKKSAAMNIPRGLRPTGMMGRKQMASCPHGLP